MILTVPSPSAATRRPPAPAPIRECFPAEMWSAADETEASLSATIPMTCAPFDWPAPAGRADPAANPLPAPVEPPRPVSKREIPWADRRMADRRPVRLGSRAEIRRWGSRGPDMAEELIDVSESGLKVRLSSVVHRGEKLDVTMWGPEAAWCGRGQGVVRWVVIGEAGTVIAGLELTRRLTAQSLVELT